MRDYPLRITEYCANCRRTCKFLWIVDAFHCVGNEHEIPPREGCGRALRIKGRKFLPKDMRG